jgi:zinc protease
MSVVEKEYSNRNKKKNAEYGDAYRDNYLDNEPIPSSEDEYQIWKMLVPQLPVEAINMAAKELISDNDTNLVVFDFAQEKAGLTYPTTATMQETVNKARAEKLQPWVDNVKNEPLITTMPKKGSIVKETENKTLGYKELKLSNGATVILKKTDFKDDEVQMQAVSKGGESLYGPADYANLKAFDYVMSASGLGNFSNTELEKALAGKQASASVALGLTRQYVNGQTTPTDIETMMQLVYLNFTNIKKDEKSYNSLMSTLSLQLKNKDLMPESALQDTVTNAINRYNPRFANLDVADLDKVSYDRILQIAKERLANAGQFVFTFVGNFDEAKLRPLIEQYIASLPSTGKVDNFKDVRTFAKGDKTIEFSRKMETPKPYVMEWYSNKMPYTLENSIKTDAVGQVVSMILLKTVREDASAAYSVGAYGSCNISGNDCYINMMAYAPISDPTKVNLAKDLIKKGFAEASVKMDADMVQKVKDYMLKNADESAKKNGHWMSILTTYKDYGLDFQSNYKKIVSELTPQSLSAFLKNVVLAGKNHIEVVMRPEEAKK